MNVPLIAIVDDDLGIREALSDFFMSVGYRARTYCSAEEFLTLRPSSGIDILVVDLMMTGMSGLDLQSSLRSEGGSPPLIMMTSHDDVAISNAAFAGGAVGFVHKPFDTSTLLASVDMALRIASATL